MSRMNHKQQLNATTVGYYLYCIQCNKRTRNTNKLVIIYIYLTFFIELIFRPEDSLSTRKYIAYHRYVACTWEIEISN